MCSAVRRRDLLADALLAAAFTGASQYEIWVRPLPGLEGSVSGPRLQIALWTLFFTVPIAFRRIYPLPAIAVMMLAPLLRLSAFLGHEEAQVNLFETFLALVLMSYSTAANTGGRSAVAGAGLLILGTLASGARNLSGGHFGELFGTLVVLSLAWAVGKAIRRRTRQALDLEARRELDIREAVGIERASIARELHDVVAHGVTLMVLQAGAARQVLSSDSDRARQSLLALEASGRSALAELRRMLALLGPDQNEDEPGDRPGLSQLDVLAGRARATGTTVDLQIDGDLGGLPAGLDAAAYRILQEAFTNSLRHARPGGIKVAISHRDGHLDLAVTEVEPRSAAPQRGAGLGLIGMRERAAVYGGTLEAGPAPDGTFQVRARLPVPAE